MKTLYTIGHSTYSMEEFIDIVKHHKIDVLVDVRFVPYSKFANQFNRENLKLEIKKHGLKYLFMGDLLGSPSMMEGYRKTDGSIDFDKRSQEQDFKDGMERTIAGLDKDYKIILMCSEKEPSNCHRHLLLASSFIDKNISIKHILSKDEIIDAKNLPFSQQSLF